MNTLQAFDKLVASPDIWRDKIPESTIRSWRKRLLDNKVTIDAMEAALKKVGAKKVPEKWTFKKS